MFRCLALIFLCVTAFAPTAAPQRKVVKALESYLDSCAAFGWSGVALVARDGKVLVHAGFGLADRESGREVQADTLFEIASATKPITACAIMALVEDGVVDLQASIADYLPGVPDDKQVITVEHLLAHTSGMPRHATGGGGDDLERAVRGYLSTPAARRPGLHQYWNGGYALLAGIIERVSGKSYMDFCRERIFEPAGMQHTGFSGDTQLPLDQQAFGYDGGAPVRLAAQHAYGSYGWQYKGMGGVVTSASDLQRFVRAFEDGKLLKRKTVESMQRGRSMNYGLGWGLAETRRGTLRVGHGGDVRGFHAQLQRFPEERALVIVLSNVDGIPLFKLAWNLEALLFGEDLPYPAPPPVSPLAEGKLEALTGTYLDKRGERLIVERLGTGLTVGAEGQRACAALAGGAVDRALTTYETRARALLQAVRDGEPTPILEALAPRIPKSWPDTLIRIIWPQHLERWGALEEVRVLGARSASRGNAEVLLRLDHTGGTAQLKILFAAERLSIFDLKGPRFLVQGRFGPAKKGAFQGFDWEGGKAATLAFRKGRRGASTLVVSSPGGDKTTFQRQD